MKVETRVFGKTTKGEEVTLYSITNDKGMCAEVINYGAILVNLKVPNKRGELVDVVLGYDNVEQYFVNPSFFGATIGPNANRIGGASYEIDGVRYQLDVNDGPNNLHTHKTLGYHKVMWAAEVKDDGVTFTWKDADGNMGFPGNRTFAVTYSLTNDNKLILHYEGSSDVKTLMNFTNHTYFNLNGHSSGRIEDHVLTLNASKYTPVVEGAIPTGELSDVAGTPMDFLVATRIGDRIEDSFEQLVLTGGYDHNWVVDDWNGELRQIATVTAPGSDFVLKTYTDLPGVQFYAGNFIEPEPGKDGASYGKRNGMCLETQYFPDTANKPHFPSAFFGPDRPYDSMTVYEFAYI